MKFWLIKWYLIFNTLLSYINNYNIKCMKLKYNENQIGEFFNKV